MGKKKTTATIVVAVLVFIYRMGRALRVRIRQEARRIRRRAKRKLCHTIGTHYYTSYPETSLSRLVNCVLFQKVMRLDTQAPSPVHPSSIVGPWSKIKMGENVYPGFNVGHYIQAINGIIFGSNILIGPNVCIVSANHDPANYDKYIEDPPIEISDNVWIGANSTILPSVKIGKNVIIGAGSVVTGDIPDDCIATGNPCLVIKHMQT